MVGGYGFFFKYEMTAPLCAAAAHLAEKEKLIMQRRGITGELSLNK